MQRFLSLGAVAASFLVSAVASAAGPYERPDRHNLLDGPVGSGYTFVCHGDTIPTAGGGVDFDTWVSGLSGTTAGCPDVDVVNYNGLAVDIVQDMGIDDYVLYYGLSAPSGTALYAPSLFLGTMANAACYVQAEVTVRNVTSNALEVYPVLESCSEVTNLTSDTGYNLLDHKYRFVSADVYVFELPLGWQPGDPFPPPQIDSIRLNMTFDECMLRADINGDDKVDLSDRAILLKNYGQCSTPGNPIDLSHGDVNGDSCVTMTDFSILSNEFGKDCTK